MKKHFVRVLSLVLVVLTIFSVPTFAANEFDATNSVEIVNSNEPTNPTELDVSDEAALSFDELAGDGIVGKMYICTQQRGFGHAWIYVESCFNGDIPVGCYTLKPYQGVSIGTFAVTRSDGIGVYYNVEAYCGNKYDTKNTSWLGMEITKDQLLTINKEIKGWNYWDLYFNCTFFAAKVWNSVSSKKIVPIVFPFFIKWQILAKGGDKNIEMKEVAKEDCFKQKKTGDKAYLEQCSDKSLDSKLF